MEFQTRYGGSPEDPPRRTFLKLLGLTGATFVGGALIYQTPFGQDIVDFLEGLKGEGQFPSTRVHQYRNPQVSIDRVGINAVYFLPKGDEEGSMHDWKERIEEVLKEVVSFYDDEFNGLVQFRQRVVKMIGLSSDEDYGSFNVSLYPELADRLLRKGGDHYDRSFLRETGSKASQIIMTFYDINHNQRRDMSFYSFVFLGRGETGNGFGWVFLPAKGLRTGISEYQTGNNEGGYDTVQVPMASLAAHELGHAFGMPHSVNDNSEPFLGDIMDARSTELPLRNSFLLPHYKRDLGINP